jgi:protein ImuB
MKRILCVRLPNWPLQRLVVVLQSDDGSDVGPILLYARDPRRGELVVTCSRAAHVCGVRPGMPLAEAGSLAQRIRSRHTPCAVIHGTRGVPTTYLHDPAADLAALAKLAEECERFSPLVGWNTVESCLADEKAPGKSAPWWSNLGGWAEVRDGSALGSGPAELFLDVTGIGVLFGGEERLLTAVEEEFTRRGYRVKLAIAGTIGAAWALTFGDRSGCGEAEGATAGASRTQPQPPISAEASRPAELSPLSISALRVPPETIDLLAQLGVTTIGQLLELPRDGLASRFGKRLSLRVDQALGSTPETIVPHRPPPQFQAEWILDVPRGDRPCLDLILQQLLERVAKTMAPRQEGAVRLSCRLDCAGGAPLKLEVGLFRPSAIPRHWWSLVEMRLEQTPLPGPVGRVTVQVLQSAPLENRQHELFGGEALEGTRELGLLIDRLSSRLGMEAVVRPQLKHDPLPERAFCEVPLAGNSNPKRQRGGTSPKSKVQSLKSRHATSTLDFGLWTLDYCESVLFRPLELLDPPVMLEVLSVVPDGPPIRFCFRGQVHRVARYWGAERIESGWWRGRSVRRDYFRVETEEGERIWLFRRLEDGAWGMQGVFG